jgi:tetratricopeptide (TPR) repeat protein
MKSLEKEPARRYQNAAQISEDIQRYLNDQPIFARRASSVYRLRKWVVRHKVFVTFAAASIVIVAGARLWMEHLDEWRFAQIERTRELLELREAIIECELAEVLDETGRHERAEPKYRNALATLRRLQQDDRSGPAALALANLLIKRVGPSDKDLEDAEDLFLEALAIFENNPVTWMKEQLEALQGLRKLYGPDVWDEPEQLAEVETKLKILEAASAPADPGRPPVGRPQS